MILRPTPISRREALRLGAGTLLSLGLWPGALRAELASLRYFRFLAVNDTHCMTPECAQWLGRAVNQMKRHAGVELCLIAGDLTEHAEPENFKAVRRVFRRLGVPVYVQIGNHDYGEDDDRSAYDRFFPGRLNYSFEHAGWQFIALDSSQGRQYKDTSIQPHTFKWLEDNLPSLDPSKPTVLFTHFPLGMNVTYRPLNADALLERFLDFNLRAVFNGHYHGLTERNLARGVATTNRCCALKRGNHDKSVEKGYFLCAAERDGTITRTFIEVPVPKTTA